MDPGGGGGAEGIWGRRNGTIVLPDIHQCPAPSNVLPPHRHSHGKIHPQLLPPNPQPPNPHIRNPNPIPPLPPLQPSLPPNPRHLPPHPRLNPHPLLSTLPLLLLPPRQRRLHELQIPWPVRCRERHRQAARHHARQVCGKERGVRARQRNFDAGVRSLGAGGGRDEGE